MGHLMFFNYPLPSKSGSVYEGNKTAEAMLEFAAELSSSCSLSNMSGCTDMQHMMLEEYDKFSSSRLREDASALANEAENARNFMMGINSQMHQTQQNEEMERKAKKEAIKVLGGQMKIAMQRVEKSWERS